MATKVGPKGQVVISKRIRDELGIEPGFVAIQRRVGDHVEIRFYPPEHDRSLRGVLEGSIRRRVPPEGWAEAEEEAWLRAASVAEGGSRDE